ncbi:Hypothetical predicted protein [Paramuricea clavata]|uniref:Uncharacterized protein n=1 Tax=Paramuricea clavata TaxID=317549 RepID=A0A6S7K5J9_PARCT|nr:Hypothetical predicted protein [Paramuricea clavata]
MSNPDHDACHGPEPEVRKVDERLSKLSLIARNVTLRLSSQTTTRRGNISRKVTEKVPHNPKEPVEDSKKKVANVKTLNKIKNADLCSTSVDLTSMSKETEVVGSKNDCSGSSMQIEKDTQSSPKVKTSISRTSLLTEQFKTEITSPDENSQQSNKYRTEVVGIQTECSECPKQVEQVTRQNCKIQPNTQTNNTKTSQLAEQLITEKVSPKKSNETQKCNSPKQTSPASRKIPGQMSSGKSRIPFGAIRRRKSMKLGERSLVRRKSFLKKGDGLAARKQINKKIKTNDTESGEMMESYPNEKQQTDDKGKTSLRMPGRRDNTNGTFLLTRNKKFLNKAPACDGSKTMKSSFRSRRQWNENGAQTYEAMIFSSVFAFSEELRESSDIIHSKLQALYDSTNKIKTNSVFTKKSSGLTKEWRQNNRELLDSGSQEIAGIFSNLRIVESNLKTVDQAVSTLLKEKSRSKERISGSTKPKDRQIVQKGIK